MKEFSVPTKDSEGKNILEVNIPSFQVKNAPNRYDTETWMGRR